MRKIYYRVIAWLVMNFITVTSQRCLILLCLDQTQFWIRSLILSNEQALNDEAVIFLLKRRSIRRNGRFTQLWLLQQGPAARWRTP